MFGGGITIQYGGLPVLGSAWKYPFFSHVSYSLFSTALWSYALGISLFIGSILLFLFGS